MTNESSLLVGRYRKRPVVVEVVHWDGSAKNASLVINWILSGGGTARYHEETDDTAAHIAVDTLEGTMRASSGDYVIRGVSDEFYPCKPDIFVATYESAVGS